MTKMKKILAVVFMFTFFSIIGFRADASSKEEREARKKSQMEAIQPRFMWWPTDAQPAPVKDLENGGYWWWPRQPGTATPWGNRGYVYVYKIIYDYKAPEEPVPTPKAEVTSPPAQPEMKPSLLIKKIMKNVKIYFDYNKADLREDHTPILNNAVHLLGKNPTSSILITGNCDARGSEEYNMKLGAKRAETVKNFMLQNGIPEDRIKIVSRGKLDAVAHVADLLGMQKDRNAQFMVAEVDEIMIPAGSFPEEQEAKPVEEGKYVVEKNENVESQPKVSSREYVIQKNDSLWKIAAKEMGDGHRWKYLYELNKDRIKNPNKLKAGMKIIIPVE